jgi:hypothetical protein
LREAAHVAAHAAIQATVVTPAAQLVAAPTAVAQHPHHLQQQQQQQQQQQLVGLHPIAAVPAVAGSSQHVVPMMGPDGQISHMLVSQPSVGRTTSSDGCAIAYNGVNMYQHVAAPGGSSYVQHVLVPKHATTHPGGASVAIVDAHGDAVASGGAGVSMAAMHQMQAAGHMTIVHHAGQQRVIIPGSSGVQLGPASAAAAAAAAAATIPQGGIVYPGGITADASGAPTMIVGSSPSGNVFVPVQGRAAGTAAQTCGQAQPNGAQVWPILLSAASQPTAPDQQPTVGNIQLPV